MTQNKQNQKNETKTENLTFNQERINKAQSSVTASNSILDKIHAFKRASKHTLLIDISGSMSEYIGNNWAEGPTKHQVLQELLTKIPAGTKLLAFNHRLHEDFGIDKLPSPSGGTDMALAFKEAKSRNLKELVLITDGMPDSEQDALNESKNLKIDIIYIGPQPRPAFLEKLANMTSGSFTNIDMLQATSVKELENKVQLLLGG